MECPGPKLGPGQEFGLYAGIAVVADVVGAHVPANYGHIDCVAENVRAHHDVLVERGRINHGCGRCVGFAGYKTVVPVVRPPAAIINRATGAIGGGASGTSIGASDIGRTSCGGS